MIKNGCHDIREASIDQEYIPREPIIDYQKREELLEKAKPGREFVKEKYNGSRLTDIKYCRRCLYSSASATPMQFDSTGLCMGCKVYETKEMISEAKYQTLEKSLIIKIQDILSQAVKGRKYDCIVSVSGGKDSYYQVHYVKNVLGLKPLLVTYNGNNYSEIGWKNLWNMRDVFDCDHIVVSPSVKQLKN